MEQLYAQDASYWDTTVTLSKSAGDITELLDEHGCEQSGIQWSRDGNGAKAMSVFFRIDGRGYRADFTTLAPDPNKNTKTKIVNLIEQAEKQMGRIAWWYLKSALTMARYGHEEVLAPYLLTAGPKGQSTTIQQAVNQGQLPAGVDFMLGHALALPPRREPVQVEEYVEIVSG